MLTLSVLSGECFKFMGGVCGQALSFQSSEPISRCCVAHLHAVFLPYAGVSEH